MTKPRVDWRPRFWSKVDKSAGEAGCWPWRAGCTDNGYGSFSLDGRAYGAHRVSYALAHSSIPKGKEVCHTCDNPPCVNPAHLFAGTHKQNMMDKQRKSRATRLTGVMNGRAKITEGTARRIFVAYRDGHLTQEKIAKLFGVKRSQVADIVNKRTHRDATRGL